MSQEFLPLCDVLFNIISLAAYFCDVVFDAVTVYSLYEQKKYGWFTLTACLVIFTQVTCQVCSLRWYVRRNNCDVRAGLTSRSCHADPKKNCDVGFTLLLHLLQCGIVGRYLKLLIPVDVKFVKHDVRDLCLLRLIHGFCQAIPMLLIQLYLIWLKTDEEISNLNCVSTALSLFSVCWALASFNKNIRKKNIHKLVMTWMGVIFQFFWRLGTVTSRVVTLTIYASLYHHWTFLVIGGHWTCMFIWLVVSTNFGHDAPPVSKRMFYSSLLAYVYTFCYINVSETNSVAKMVTFYVVMFLENVLLAGLWVFSVGSALITDESPELPGYSRRWEIIALVVGAFAGGILFLLLYYRYFHVRKLKYKENSRPVDSTHHENPAPVLEDPKIANSNSRNDSRLHILMNSDVSASDATTTGTSGSNKTIKKPGNVNNYSRLGAMNHYHNSNGHVSGPVTLNTDLYVPGVFSCRLNRGIKRKKKKPTSFVPPPTAVPIIHSNLVSTNANGVKNASVDTSHIPSSSKFRPWWKVHHASGASDHDHEGSVGSRVNIQQKLREKKEQQLAELRVIQEEIKQGKLERPTADLDSAEVFPSDAGPPKNKRAPWLVMDPPPQQPSFDLYHDHRLPAAPNVMLMGAAAGGDPRSNTPEILLSPYYLDNSRIYGIGVPRTAERPLSARRVLDDLPEVSLYPDGDVVGEEDIDDVVDWHPGSMATAISSAVHVRGRRRPGGAGYGKPYRLPHVPSDIDSQISLPRSYTLPREFKYSKKPKTRKVVRAELFVSTNSSDGDVDSAEDEAELDDDDDGPFSHLPLPLPMARPAIYYYNSSSVRYSSNHETPL